MNYIVLIVAALAIFIVVASSLSFSANKKLKNSLIHSFGQIPRNQDYELESISAYHFYKAMNESNPALIDAITWDDLDMDKVYRRINVCCTSVGEEYLYSILHEPAFDKIAFAQREKLITYLSENPEIRLELQMILSKMGKSNFNGIPSFLFDAKSKALRYPFLYKILAVIPLACAAVLPFHLIIGILGLVISFLVNTAVYYLTKRKIETELGTISYFASMLWCCGRIIKIKETGFNVFTKALKESFQVFHSLSGKISGIMKKSLSELEFIVEYFKIVFLTDFRNYSLAIDTICKNPIRFHELYKNLGEIDVAICILSYRNSLAFYTTPQFIEDKAIRFRELVHPLLSNPVANDALIKKNSIITGSNASGKSTFVKAIAVNGILAQTIYTCTAKEYTTRVSLVMTSMAVRDDISEGDSYFITEIKSLKRILDKIETVYCTCFIDEILKGTNTIERIAASASVLNFLSDANCLCLVASHDIELTQILRQRYDNYNFCEQITDNGIEFTYQLNQGVSKTRNAIKLLHYMDFDDGLVKNAENLVGKFMSTKKWESI